MRISAAIRGDLAEMMKAERRKGEAATFAGVDQATQGLKLDLRKQITGAGMGQRLANTWRSKTYPPDRQSFKPGGFVWSKAPKIIYVFAVGITIRSAKGFFLAVPLPAAGKYGDGRKKVTPGGWEQVHGQRLRFVYRRGRASLLVADNARLSSRGVAVGRKGKGATKRGVTIPIFVLLPQVTLKKRFDVAGAAATWGQKIPDLIAAAWETKKR